MALFSDETRKVICEELNKKYLEYKELKTKRHKLYLELGELDEILEHMRKDIDNACTSADLRLEKVFDGTGHTITDDADRYNVKHRFVLED
mgnify:CR=1 FL=1|jgi:hypothetical protein